MYVGVHSWSSTVHGETLISATLNICHTKTITGTVTKMYSDFNHIIKNCMLIFRVSALNIFDAIDKIVTIFSYCGGFTSIMAVLFTVETQKINIQFLTICLR